LSILSARKGAHGRSSGNLPPRKTAWVSSEGDRGGRTSAGKEELSYPVDWRDFRRDGLPAAAPDRRRKAGRGGRGLRMKLVYRNPRPRTMGSERPKRSPVAHADCCAFVGAAPPDRAPSSALRTSTSVIRRGRLHQRLSQVGCSRAAPSTARRWPYEISETASRAWGGGPGAAHATPRPPTARPPLPRLFGAHVRASSELRGGGNPSTFGGRCLTRDGHCVAARAAAGGTSSRRAARSRPGAESCATNVETMNARRDRELAALGWEGEEGGPPAAPAAEK